jgi:predicted enzyme related to lactoylglutathione lyase
VIGQILYAKHPDRLATFYGSLFEMEKSEIDGASFTLVRPGMEIHIVKIPDSIARVVTLSTPPDPRVSTPLKFTVEVPSVDQLAANAQSLGGVPHGEPWNWHSRRLLDIIDLEGTSFRCSSRTRVRARDGRGT